jgi:hypothetical protein
MLAIQATTWFEGTEIWHLMWKRRSECGVILDWSAIESWEGVEFQANGSPVPQSLISDWAKGLAVQGRGRAEAGEK